MSRENVDLTRRAFQAFNDRDLDAILAGLHDELEPRTAAGIEISFGEGQGFLNAQPGAPEDDDQAA
jgi:hypothetical protein